MVPVEILRTRNQDGVHVLKLRPQDTTPYVMDTTSMLQLEAWIMLDIVTMLSAGRHAVLMEKVIPTVLLKTLRYYNLTDNSSCMSRLVGRAE